jgi:hypothetical protein
VDDEDLDLREHVLVDEGRALADEGHAEATRSPPAHDVVDRPDQALGAVLDPLRNERVRLIDGEVESRSTSFMGVSVASTAF